MSRPKIVVWDPHGALHEGQVVQDGENTRRAELMRGLVTLPYELSLRELGAVGGYARRGFGDGEVFDLAENRRGCGMLLAASQDSTRISWTARFVQSGHEPPNGRVQIVPMPNVLGPVACAPVPQEGPIDLGALGQADRWGGWTIKGTAALSCPTAGYLSVGLQAQAQRLCVLWFAASVLRGS